ncbi:MAG: hypothetical protein JWL59_1902 [Chthoniobacteraceae bacterium]|nr:hypothetical protein [Chthoniobacteraceae bacterium]
MSRADFKRFHSVAQSYLEQTWALFPHEASELGLHQFDTELGENDARTWQKHGLLLRATLSEVEAIPDASFGGDDWLDRRGLLSVLRTGLHWNTTLERWRNNPQVHCDTAINSIFNLLIRNSERLAQIRPAIESRLQKIPRFLSQGAACLRAPVPLWTRLARKSCDHVGEFLTSVGEQLAPLSPTPDRTRQLVRDAIAAFSKYADAAENKEPGAANGFAIGREAFEFLTREKTGLPYSLPEIRALGADLAAKLTIEIAAEARKFGRKKVGQILEEAAARWTPAHGSLIEEYRRVTSEVRQQFEQAKVVTFPKNETCRVTLVPPFLRHHFPTAAYSQPGAFDKDQTGIFWVNDLSATLSDPAKRAAEVRQHFGMEFTCAHEAYPGHHLQFVLQNQHRSKLRRLSSHAIFYEGWTLWCEKMAVERGVIELPEARLIQLHDALWRAHRIGIDCGLHDGELTYAAACRRLQEGVGFTPARARGDVNWYTSSPTIPMSYLLGRLEVERLHAQLVGREGWSLLQFNDWILSFGAIPWRWIWEARLRPDA